MEKKLFEIINQELNGLKNKNQYTESNKNKIPDECPKCAKLYAPCSPLLIYKNEMICERYYQMKLKYENV
ncbi:hypothetical protein H8E88_14995 [candidate division KSB1 bacterium]|nr:hypothetical protein [candidate division KSB1 bacterium]MBL7094324.1 hypothetical protein [candidate division KSB1 bacterium]